MYACTLTHIHTHKTFFCAIRKFYFDKKKAKNYSSDWESSAARA